MTTEGLRVLAVDDERPALDELAYLLREQPRVATVMTASDASGALRILEDEVVDAVFLDIRMPRLSGLDLAKILARFVDPPKLVFVTAYDEHAVAAFDLKALDYVMKPVRAERLAEAVRRVEDAVNGAKGEPVRTTADETIAVELAGTVRFIQRSDVRYVEAAGDYARLHTATGSHLVRTPLATLEEQWQPAGFVRVHRSYLVNLAHIHELRLEGGHYAVRIAGSGPGAQVLPVSRRHGRELRDRLVRGARPRATT